MKNSEVNNKHRNKDSELKTILYIWHFKRKILPDGILLTHKSSLCAYAWIQQWGVNYCESYALVVNWISVRSLLATSSIHEFSNK